MDGRGGPAPIVPKDEQRALYSGGLDLAPIKPAFHQRGDGIGDADGGLDRATWPVPRLDGKAVTPEQRAPVAENHSFERVEYVAGDEVVESLGHGE